MSTNASLAPTGLDAFFAARGIAVIGASPQPTRIGGRVVTVLEVGGYSGHIYPVNPNYAGIEVLGHACYASVADLPDPVDIAIICLAAARVPQAIRECGARGIRGAVVFADGFTDADKAALRVALDEASAASGLRMLGPNTVGIRSFLSNTFATFSSEVGTGNLIGNVATVSQSGGLGNYLGAAQLRRRGIGAAYLIDTGGEFDITSADCVDYLAEAPGVGCISLILEGTSDGRKLMRAVEKATGRGIPVAMLKTARSAAAVKQAASHTGSLAGEAALFDAALRSVGAIIAEDEMELMDAVVIASSGKIPKGRRLGVVTPSGGYAILTLDAADRYGMQLPEPAIAATEAEKAELLHGGFANPLDFSSTISAGPNALTTSLAWMAKQPNVDAVLLWQASSGGVHASRQEALFKTLSAVVAGSDKPFFVAGLTTPDYAERLRAIGVLWFEEPSRLVHALGVVAPREKPTATLSAKAETHADVRAIVDQQARDILSHLAELPQVPTYAVDSTEAALALAERTGGRLVLKVESGHEIHKSELGYVAGPVGRDGIAAAFAALDAARKRNGAADAPIVAQPFEAGVELALGAYLDPVFGPAVMVASGGIFLEILRDTAFAVGPIGVEAAKDMILGLKGAPLLLGARGKPVADVAAAAAALAALSRFISEANGAYGQIDINPLIVREAGKGVVAVDAVLVPADAAHG